MEILIVPAFLVFAAGIYLFARFGAAVNPPTPAEELAQLSAYRERLQGDLQRARAECWDRVMVAQLSEKIQETDARIARFSPSATGRSGR